MRSKILNDDILDEESLYEIGLVQLTDVKGRQSHGHGVYSEFRFVVFILYSFAYWQWCLYL